jgi:hypothetical protein
VQTSPTAQVTSRSDGGGFAVGAFWQFVGTATLAACLTVLFLCMRSVMDIGGSCASGGPYEIANPCPAGVAGLMVGSIWIGLVAVAVMLYGGHKTGGPTLVVFAWPALFLSLGFNFLQYGIHPPSGEGLVWGWLICGVLFVAMGGIPLIGAIAWYRHRDTIPKARLWSMTSGARIAAQSIQTLLAARRGSPTQTTVPSGVTPTWTVGPDGRITTAAGTPGSPSSTPTVPSSGWGAAAAGAGAIGSASGATTTPSTADAVSRLERLAELHRRGDLTVEEYERAKKAVLEGKGGW